MINGYKYKYYIYIYIYMKIKKKNISFLFLYVIDVDFFLNFHRETWKLKKYITITYENENNI